MVVGGTVVEGAVERSADGVSVVVVDRAVVEGAGSGRASAAVVGVTGSVVAVRASVVGVWDAAVPASAIGVALSAEASPGRGPSGLP